MRLPARFFTLPGIILAAFILTRLYLADNLFANLSDFVQFQFAILLLHQTEEYFYPGGFEQFYNQEITRRFAKLPHPLTGKGILAVNVLLAWPAYLLPIAVPETPIFFISGLAGIHLLNGLMHTAWAVSTKKYNPGLITSVILLIPFSLILINNLFPLMTNSQLYLSLIILAAGSCLIPLFIYMSRPKADL